jgi:hypothetical protein
MEESILETIRGMVGPDVNYDAFDVDLVTHINTYLGVLNQLGIGKMGFTIEDADARWSDFLDKEDMTNGIYNSVKSYLYMKVKLVFDCPANATLVQSLKDQSEEIAWRLKEQREYDLYGG